MRTIMLGLLAASTLLAGCETYGDTGGDPRYNSYRQYDYNNPDPQYGGYYADKYYREDNQRYRERQLVRHRPLAHRQRSHRVRRWDHNPR